MSSESDERPMKNRLPALRNGGSVSPAGEVRRTDTGGFLRSTLTGWLAEGQDRALTALARRTRSEADVLKARGELADTYEATARKVNRLRHLPQILELDDAKFAAEQEAAYEAIEQQRFERHHQERLTQNRRNREVQNAETELVESRRRKFTATQGLENQRRLKRLKLRLWETRTEAEQLDAELTFGKLRGELRPSDTSKDADIRAKAEAAFIEAQAEGNDVEADRWQKVLDALENR